MKRIFILARSANINTILYLIYIYIYIYRIEGACGGHERPGKHRDADGGTIDVALKDARVGFCQCTSGLPNAREERGVEAVLDGVGRAPV